MSTIYIGVHCSKCGNGLKPVSKPNKEAAYLNESHLNMYYEPCTCICLTTAKLKSISDQLTKYFAE